MYNVINSSVFKDNSLFVSITLYDVFRKFCIYIYNIYIHIYIYVYIYIYIYIMYTKLPTQCVVHTSDNQLNLNIKKLEVIK